MRRRWAVFVLASVAGLIMGCGSSKKSSGTGAGSPSETSWLTPCAGDDDCTRGQCLCGVCSEGCSRDDDCAGSRGAGCFDAMSPGLSEHCAASTTAEPGVCLALCTTDADCPPGETCWFEACVAAPPGPAATASEPADASDYFDVPTDVDFSEPVVLPEPELGIDGGSELVGEWVGMGEPVTAYFGPTEARAHLVIAESSGQIVGEFYWEYGMVDGGAFPGPYTAATNPDIGYPTEVEPDDYGGLRWPNPRIPYRVFDGTLNAGRFTFWTSTLDLWSDWCAMQTAYPYDVEGKSAYRCIPQSATASNTDPGKFKLCASAGRVSCTTDYPEDPLCVAYCECSASSCHADLRWNTVVLDLELDASTMTGVMVVGPDAWVMEFTRETP